MTYTNVALGRPRPDGSRAVTVTDDRGLGLRGDVGPEPASSDGPQLPLAVSNLERLVAMAGRAPSVHNTQPWLFRVRGDVLELHADPSRQLRHADPAGREMLISCGAALYGLRLAIRTLGYLPGVEVLPDPAQPGLVARVWPAGAAPITRYESELVAALPHRHTHRGSFAPGEVPGRLLAGLRLDAVIEHAELLVIDSPELLDRLIGVAAAAAREMQVTDELRAWMRSADDQASDGVPAFARVRHLALVPPAPAPGDRAGGLVPLPRGSPGDDGLRRWLPQRDLGMPGLLPPGGYPPAVTAVLATGGDDPADWVSAGQALHRLLLHAATRWVFASLQSQSLESPARRAEIRGLLRMPGWPQLLLQFGRANSAPATQRRPAGETLRQALPLPGNLVPATRVRSPLM